MSDSTTSPPEGAPRAPRPATAEFMARHPAHWIALGMGSGLAPAAPGTVGTFWAWFVFAMVSNWVDDAGWAVVIPVALLVGWWACTRTAQHLGQSDPGAIVWDEVVAFWLVLWLITPVEWPVQALALALFRFFDAVKPGPVGWADRRFKLRPGRRIGWREGFGILFDDLVAALCTLLTMAVGWRLWQALASGSP